MPKEYLEAPSEQDIKVAVDAVIFTVIDGALQVLMIQMKKPPSYAGRWALPGGLLMNDETAEAAVRRILAAHCNVRDVHVEQLATFDDPQRDVRTRVVSLAYLALMPQPAEPPVTSAKYAAIRWWPVAKPPRLAYDHAHILATAVERLRGKLAWSNLAWSLLPREFTLTELQRLYEVILGRVLDKRNFRKKILTLGVLKETGRQRAEGAHRPAALYRFATRKPTAVNLLG